MVMCILVPARMLPLLLLLLLQMAWMVTADWPSVSNTNVQSGREYLDHPQRTDSWSSSPWADRKLDSPTESSWNSLAAKPWHFKSEYKRKELKSGYDDVLQFDNVPDGQTGNHQMGDWTPQSYSSYGDQTRPYQGFGNIGSQETTLSHLRYRRNSGSVIPKIETTRVTSLKKVAGQTYEPKEKDQIQYWGSHGLWLIPKEAPKHASGETELKQPESGEVTQLEDRKEVDKEHEIEIEVVARGESKTSVGHVATPEDGRTHVILDDGGYGGGHGGGYGGGHGGGQGYGGGAHYGGGHNQYGNSGGFHGDQDGGYGGGGGHQGDGSYQGEGGFDRGSKWHGNHHGNTHGRSSNHGHFGGDVHGDRHGDFKKGHKDHYKQHGQRYKTYSYGGHGWYKENHHGQQQGHGGLQGHHQEHHKGHFGGKNKGGQNHKHSRHGHFGGWKNENGWH